MDKSHLGISVVAVLCLLAASVTGQAPYSQNRQICCDGVVHNRGNSTMCCGTTPYNDKSHQCCYPELTVIPLQGEAENGTVIDLTCCGGKGAFVGYNELCCGGVVSKNPTVTSEDDRFGCCDTKIYATNRQTCCNGAVYDDASRRLNCCGDGTLTYTNGDATCCNGTIVPIPANVSQFNFQCCGNQGYDNTQLVCDPNDHTLYPKPQNVPCQNEYTRICGGRVIAPQQLCCNDELFNPPYLWVDDGRGKGSGYFGLGASCCPGGIGIIQSKKEVCCKSGVVPIDHPKQSCCGDTIYDASVNDCCDGQIVPLSVGATCCGRKSYLQQTQLCCGGNVFNRSEGYDDCCTPPNRPT